MTKGDPRDMAHVDYRIEGASAVVTFTNPPVNSFSHGVRAEIAAALDRATADPLVKAVVITGGGGLFSGGADIREFGTPLMLRAPTLRHLIDAIESSDKPVVAAI